jgi:molybdate transport system substrate-binding protein
MKLWPVPAVAALGVAVVLLWHRQASRPNDRPDPLTVFCAASLKQPTEEAGLEFERQTGIQIQLQFGGSATLLAQIELSRSGDLYLAADEGAVRDARARRLIHESIPLVHQVPVIAVAAGNPLNIKNLDDLLRSDVRVALANPETASIGRVVRNALGSRFGAFADKVTVMKPTVTEIATDLTLGAVDAAILWDSVVPQFRGIEPVAVPEFADRGENASASVVVFSKRRDDALRLARFLGDPAGSGAVFARHGFKPPRARPGATANQ